MKASPIKRAQKLIDEQLDGKEFIEVRLLHELLRLLRAARVKRLKSEAYVSVLHAQLRSAGHTPKVRP
jgi:hypothetical protein